MFLVHDNFEPSEAYHLFMGASAFEIEEDFLAENAQWFRKPFWLAMCPDVESLSVILRSLHFEGSLVSLQNKCDLLGHVGASYPVFSGASEFLQYLGTQASDRRLATLRHHLYSTTVLFYVAQGLEISISRGSQSQDWIKLGIEVLKNDPEVLANGSVLSLTPLTHWFRCMFSYTMHRKLEALQVPDIIFQTWADMVRQAGIDLCQYGAMEAEAWKSRPKLTFHDEFSWDSHSYHSQAAVAERLLFGPAPADWTFEVQHVKRWPLKSVLFELRDPPGSFPRDPRVPNRICWQPTDEEEDEGHWVKISEREIPSQPLVLQSATTYLQEKEEPPPIIQLLNHTQDDTSTVPLLLLRGEQTSRINQSSVVRSHSQPPVYGTDTMKDKFHMKRGRCRDWLPCLHVCSFDSKWRFARCGGWRCTRSVIENLGLRRDCIGGRNIELASAQQSDHWQCNSFIARITACQNDWPTNELRKQRHTGLSDCPQKCRTVNLEKLHVPEELKAYHPRRRHKPDDLED